MNIPELITLILVTLIISFTLESIFCTDIESTQHTTKRERIKYIGGKTPWFTPGKVYEVLWLDTLNGKYVANDAGNVQRLLNTDTAYWENVEI